MSAFISGTRSTMAPWLVCFLVVHLLFVNPCFSQLKFLIEDFEGFADGTEDLKPNGIFTYGNVKGNIDYRMDGSRAYSGERFLRLYRNGAAEYGGWGKGIGLNMELDVATDYLNFYINVRNIDSVKIELQEDDNQDNKFSTVMDDSWACTLVIPRKNEWHLISVPLSKFMDSNAGGDKVFNVTYAAGKLMTLIMSFKGSGSSGYDQSGSLDFLCFSKGKLPVGAELFDAPAAKQDDFCNLGIWSKEGNTGDFSEIAAGFENEIRYGSEKKLGVVHFFQPFSIDGNGQTKHYPSVERINKVVRKGYIPMITLEDHFVSATGTNQKLKQPNLYSIVEGHFDSFFADWARQVKAVEGTILLRILHEFNGDWYPWCVVNNDKNPELLVKAYRRIHDAFKKQGVTNVKFIWCPNSMSVPQEKWNFIMDAYPGDEYVDFVGLDIYNGAGKGFQLWRSFRKEGIENYFILTERMPAKPLLICEAASRERKETESISAQDKAGWIRQMSEALTTDMSKVRLLAWFNEKETFKINSSPGAQGSYLDYVLKNGYFKSGSDHLLPLLGP